MASLRSFIVDRCQLIDRQFFSYEFESQIAGMTRLGTRIFYIRLVDVELAQQRNYSGHFFSAAEAMRRILIERHGARVVLRLVAVINARKCQV